MNMRKQGLLILIILAILSFRCSGGQVGGCEGNMKRWFSEAHFRLKIVRKYKKYRNMGVVLQSASGDTAVVYIGCCCCSSHPKFNKMHDELYEKDRTGDSLFKEKGSSILYLKTKNSIIELDMDC